MNKNIKAVAIFATGFISGLAGVKLIKNIKTHKKNKSVSK